MLVAITLRYYKNYSGAKTIILSDKNNFTAIIGDNAVGKSAILEALDTYFNDRKFNRNAQSVKSGLTGGRLPYVSPIFKINIQNFLDYVNKDAKEILKDLSDINWEAIIKKVSDINQKIIEKTVTENITLNLKNNEIFIAGFGNLNSEKKVSPSDYNDIKKETGEEILFKILNGYIKEKYNYLYLPIEDNSFDNTLNLKSKKMENVFANQMMEFIQDHSDELGKSHTAIKKNFEGIIAEINEYIRDILGDEYLYKQNYQFHIRRMLNNIISDLLSQTTINKRDKDYYIPFEQFSAGEKRNVMLVTFLTLLKNNKANESYIIGIDEPESSLNFSKIYDIFDKLYSHSEHSQIILTTHWYGFSPFINNGLAVYIEDQIKYIDLSRNTDQIRSGFRKTDKKTDPETKLFYAKRFSDFTQSISAKILTSENSFIVFCEGYTDKLYFKHFLEILKEQYDIPEEFHVISLAGSANVKSVMEYLRTIFDNSDLSYVFKENKHKVLAIIDTDKNEKIGTFNNIDNFIYFKRISSEKGYDIHLVDYKDKTNVPADIEDMLDKQIVLEILQEQKYEIVDKQIIEEASKVESEYFYKCIDSNKKRDEVKEKLKKSENKVKLAEKYIEKTKKVPKCFEDLIKEIFAK